MRLTGRRWLSSAAVIGSLAALAACSSSGSSTASSPASSSSAGSTASAGLAKAQQMVTQLESTTAKYPLPTASVSGVSKLSGRILVALRQSVSLCSRRYPCSGLAVDPHSLLSCIGALLSCFGAPLTGCCSLPGCLDGPPARLTQ